jgi:hypothetical protein
LYEPALYPDKYWFAEHVGFVPNWVFEDAVHTAETYCVFEGDEHNVHVPAAPVALYDPALYPDKYWFAEHVGFVPNWVFVVAVHTAVTYCEAVGVEHN